MTHPAANWPASLLHHVTIGLTASPQRYTDRLLYKLGGAAPPVASVLQTNTRRNPIVHTRPRQRAERKAPRRVPTANTDNNVQPCELRNHAILLRPFHGTARKEERSPPLTKACCLEEPHHAQKIKHFLRSQVRRRGKLQALHRMKTLSLLLDTGLWMPKNRPAKYLSWRRRALIENQQRRYGIHVMLSSLKPGIIIALFYYICAAQ